MRSSWSRRRVLEAAGRGVSASLLGNAFGSRLWEAATVKACTLTPELEIGPYYVAYELMRSDIREGKPGVPLCLELELRDAKSCKPIQDAAIDIWHCDALGIYSGYTKVPADLFNGDHGGSGGPPPPDGKDRHHNHLHTPPPGPPPGMGEGGHGGFPGTRQTDQETFLRGVQLTDARGRVRFETIYPGWYISRDTHIHVEVHIGGHTAMPPAGATKGNSFPKYEGGHVCHIGQIAFPDVLSDEIAQMEPYRQHRGKRTMIHEDHVFQGSPGGISHAVEKVRPRACGTWCIGEHYPFCRSRRDAKTGTDGPSRSAPRRELQHELS